MTNVAFSLGNQRRGSVFERIDGAGMLCLIALNGVPVIVLIPFLRKRVAPETPVPQANETAPVQLN